MEPQLCKHPRRHAHAAGVRRVRRPRPGLFYGQDTLDGRAILVRFDVKQISKSEAHFEQSYSADGGATWEVNWIAVDRLR